MVFVGIVTGKLRLARLIMLPRIDYYGPTVVMTTITTSHRKLQGYIQFLTVCYLC